jgi:hypothetical protein
VVALDFYLEARMAYFIHPWTRQTLEYHAELIERGTVPREVDHTASNMFRARGVTPGDTMYIVSWTEGALYVHGRLVVDRVVDQVTAEVDQGMDLWEADDHVLARPGTATLFVIEQIPDTVLRKLEFIRPDGTATTPALNRSGNVDHQGFRTVRQLAPGSANELDRILNAAIARSYPNNP